MSLIPLYSAVSEKNKEKPPSFGQYYPSFKDVCVAIADDNMSVEYYQLLSSLIETPTAECLACKNFFRGFASSCRPKVTFAPIKKKDQEEEHDEGESVEEASETATPVVIKKPKLPSFEVIDAASALGIELSEDPKLENFLPQIVAVFHKKLLGKGEKENPYFYTVAVYLTQSMADQHQKQEEAQRRFER